MSEPSNSALEAARDPSHGMILRAMNAMSDYAFHNRSSNQSEDYEKARWHLKQMWELQEQLTQLFSKLNDGEGKEGGK